MSPGPATFRSQGSNFADPAGKLAAARPHHGSIRPFYGSSDKETPAGSHLEALPAAITRDPRRCVDVNDQLPPGRYVGRRCACSPLLHEGGLLGRGLIRTRGKDMP